MGAARGLSPEQQRAMDEKMMRSVSMSLSVSVSVSVSGSGSGSGSGSASASADGSYTEKEVCNGQVGAERGVEDGEASARGACAPRVRHHDERCRQPAVSSERSYG
eukprot:907828-Rhodomonas_salina.2